MEIFLQSESWIALLTLTFLEIVLGVDNIIFISIVSNKLPEYQQPKARNLGLLLAMFFRIGLLLGISYIIQFTEPLFTVFGHGFSGRDMILAGGGLFLLFKSTMEIHHKMEGEAEEVKARSSASFGSVIVQILLLDMIFSFDSILTAVGLVDHVLIMVIAVVIALIIMMIFAGKISSFINKHPTLQILALSFLILIGVMLLVEGFHVEVPKGYIYFAVFFSLAVELVNMRMRKKTSQKPVELNPRIKESKE
ncbi:TerC family protein [Echinicola vietnamensis]|uniref:Membrane protein TerC, possibly involved in tellurium resistance n=1 Tax=Echinicola vietnamensis (strain DSM 17526 / LMG 23754 / KMM 6221) TaxID=926556 RepID=L0FXM1_ECHVK|nr:TerC family protein [Echinicola vietnamensis]AGA77405.1 membrane protein TerC, possibly involved in tellurium resistance [Echinicola vietnamensis DSM 17526]